MKDHTKLNKTVRVKGLASKDKNSKFDKTDYLHRSFRISKKKKRRKNLFSCSIGFTDEKNTGYADTSKSAVKGSTSDEWAVVDCLASIVFCLVFLYDCRKENRIENEAFIMLESSGIGRRFPFGRILSLIEDECWKGKHKSKKVLPRSFKRYAVET